jgi:hypothetical protein
MKSWPKKDKVNWVEWELRRARHGGGPVTHLADQPVDLEVWLAKERDGKSWREIADAQFPKLKTEAGRSEARRSHVRVQDYLENRWVESQDQKTTRLRQMIEEQFEVTAEEFRTFVLKGRVRRTKRKTKA